MEDIQVVLAFTRATTECLVVLYNTETNLT